MNKITLAEKGIPSVKELASELKSAWDYMRKNYSKEDMEYFGGGEAGMDVRLRVYNGSWELLTGDSQYDTDHKGEWSYSFLTWSKPNFKNIASDLIDELE